MNAGAAFDKCPPPSGPRRVMDLHLHSTSVTSLERECWERNRFQNCHFESNTVKQTTCKRTRGAVTKARLHSSCQKRTTLAPAVRSRALWTCELPPLLAELSQAKQSRHHKRARGFDPQLTAQNASALRVFRSTMCSTPCRAERFRREARAACASTAPITAGP